MLSLGFGGLLICIVGAAAGTFLVLSRVRQDEAQARKTFLERLGALDQIRAQIYLSVTYVRDMLLSPDPSGAEAQTARLAPLERETHAALDFFTRGPSKPRSGNRFARCGRKSKPIGACWTAPYRGLPKNSTACGIHFSTTNWRRAVRPCCKLPTALPRSTSAV